MKGQNVNNKEAAELCDEEAWRRSRWYCYYCVAHREFETSSTTIGTKLNHTTTQDERALALGLSRYPPN